METISKTSNFIGQYFRQFIKIKKLDRKVLARQLDFSYASNDRMICAFFNKKDYLWKKSEVEKWCFALNIDSFSPIYEKLLERAGKN